MPRELEPWGGDLSLPRWLRRLLRRPEPPGPSAERVHERRQPQDPGVSVAENADRAVFGGFSDGHPGNRPKPRR
jgi:hypothetical protein